MYKRGGRVLPFAWRALAVLPIWIVANWWLWSWWLSPGRVDFVWLYVPLTIAMLYEFLLLPGLLLYFIFRIKFPQKRRAQPDLKVAVITTCVPAKESLEIVEAQLKALGEITYPHASWILDEGGSKRIKALARQYGVNYFSRQGIKSYNQPDSPFKAKTKAGNVNAWLEHVKRRGYDFFVQLDIDHIPKPNYLDKVLGHFRDKNVAWVQAPSIYSNLQYWTAKGAAEQELVFQGPLQMGFYGHSQIPFIIGSHSTYRMSMIREIGGFQPTRAEDHLDTVALAHLGYRGVFVPEVIAEGDGPETLETYLAQQFAWAYSMFQILIHHSPKLLRGMPFKAKLQFLFAQTWYPIWSLSYLVMFSAPILALLFNRNILHVDSWDFIARYLLVIASILLIWWAGRPMMQPKGLQMSWRSLLLHAIRWPAVLRAIVSAALGIKKPYMITPKGKRSSISAVTRAYRPFIVLCGIATVAVILASWIYGYQLSLGQTMFALFNVFLMLAICLVDIVMNIKQAIGSRRNFQKYWLKPVAGLAVVVLLVSASFTGSLLNYQRAYGQLLAEQNHSNIAAAPAYEEIMAQLSLSENKANASATPSLGLFDPNQDVNLDTDHIQHSFIDWNDSQSLAKQLFLAKLSGTTPLITLEPRGEEDGQKLLSQISGGYYNQQIEKIFGIINSYDSPVYVRFAHEMDLGNLYPWGNQNPSKFIAAYRHMADSAKSQKVSNIKWVWSPAGNPNAANYYPGDDVVDVVGTTVLYDRFWYGDYQPSFEEISARRAWLQQYGKPVWIAEFGAGNTDAEYQNHLIKDAVANYQAYGYSALVYLNIADANLTQSDKPDYTLKNPNNFNDTINKVLKHYK